MASATDKPPSPGPSDELTHVVNDLGLEKDSPIDCSSNNDTHDTHVDGPGMVIDSPNDTSSKGSIVTMSPYIPKSGSKLGAGLGKNVNSNKNLKGKQKLGRQILPGVFEPNSYSKFLTFSLENTKLEDADIFELHREIVSCIGREPKITRQGEETLLIEVSSPEESVKLLKMKMAKGSEVKCTPHRSLNQCKGVIYSKDLINYSEERLQEEFESQNVIEVKRMMKKVDGNLCPLPLLILTFDMLKLPDTVSAAWLRLQVRPYVPSPRRCFYCQMFGHVFTSCRRKLKNEAQICVNCGEEDHGECSRPPRCFNCKGDHAASSKTCDRYQFEKEVLAIKTKEHITFKEAKQRVLPRFKQLFSFATVVKKTSSPNVSTPLVPQKGKNLSSNLIINMETNLTKKRSLSEESLALPSSKISNKERSTSLLKPRKGPSVVPSDLCGGSVAGPSLIGGPGAGPSSIGGPVSGPSNLSGGPVAGPSDPVSGGPVAGPSDPVSGGPVAGPSDPVSGEPVAGPSDISKAQSPGLSTVGPVSSAPSISRRTLGGPPATTHAFSKALLTACSPEKATLGKNDPPESKTQRGGTAGNTSTGTRPRVPIQLNSDSSTPNAKGRTLCRGSSSKKK